MMDCNNEKNTMRKETDVITLLEARAPEKESASAPIHEGLAQRRLDAIEAMHQHAVFTEKEVRRVTRHYTEQQKILARQLQALDGVPGAQIRQGFVAAKMDRYSNLLSDAPALMRDIYQRNAHIVDLRNAERMLQRQGGAHVDAIMETIAALREDLQAYDDIDERVAAFTEMYRANQIDKKTSRATVETVPARHSFSARIGKRLRDAADAIARQQTLVNEIAKTLADYRAILRDGEDLSADVLHDLRSDAAQVRRIADDARQSLALLTALRDLRAGFFAAKESREREKIAVEMARVEAQLQAIGDIRQQWDAFAASVDDE